VRLECFNRRCMPAARRGGAALVVAIVTLLVVMLMAGAVMRSLLVDLRESRQTATELQAQWLAEAAVDRAQAQLAIDGNYEGETWRAATDGAPGDESADVGVAEIRIERPSGDTNKARLTIKARYPDHPWRRVAASRTYEFTLSAKEPPAGTLPEETAP
jgi:Tfp pilus assembly protein PilX